MLDHVPNGGYSWPDPVTQYSLLLKCKTGVVEYELSVRMILFEHNAFTPSSLVISEGRLALLAEVALSGVHHTKTN